MKHEMQQPFLLALIASTIEMTVCLLCTHQLWRMRGDSQDRSRFLLALGALLSGMLAMFVLIINISMAQSRFTTLVLQPWIGLVYLSMHIVMTLYPIKVVRPDWLTPKRYFFLFLPTLLLAITYLLFTNRWTVLQGPQDIWAHIMEPDVMARLAGLIIMLPYCLILLWLPYNKRSSSASHVWIWEYSLGLLGISLLHVTLMLTHHPALFIILPLAVSVFFYSSTEYELTDRLNPKPAADTPEDQPVHAVVSPEQTLWPRIVRLMDQEQVWRDPDLTLVSMARLCATNVTSLNHAIHQETGNSFRALLNAKRIENVATQLRMNADTDIQEAFFNAGYRSRITAWRNFKEIQGVTPTEYRQSLTSH